MKFRKRPVVIEAIQWTNEPSLFDSVEVVKKFCPAEGPFMAELSTSPAMPSAADWAHPYLHINTLEGQMRVDLNDWIIKGVKGEFYPCKPDIFTLTYDAVEELVTA